MRAKFFITTLLTILSVNLLAQNTSPSNYFPLEIGNHWKFYFPGDSILSSERWIYIDVVDTATFGLPNEILSYRVEIAEQELSSSDTNLYHIDYFTFNSNGDLCLTARGPTDTLILFDSATVYIRNPITVGDSTVREGLYNNIYTREVTEIISLDDSIHIPLGIFENCLQIEERLYFDSVLFSRNNRYFIPMSYFPIAGYGRYYNNANLIECNILTSVEYAGDILYSYRMNQNYPNPFNPTTNIKYQIPEISFVTIKIYDVLGSEIVTLVSEEKAVGSYKVEFDATSLPSGVYFYRLQAVPNGRQAGSLVETKKMVLMK